MSKPGLSFLSLFSGCGGFDIGFLEAGFNCVGAYDNDPVAVSTYNKNLPDNAIEMDLCSEDIEHPSSIDVIIAGPPCQGFSTAGKRKLDDPRNFLLLRAGVIAIQLKPKIFVLENVKGVISGEHRRYWDDLKEMLVCAGYKVKDFLADVEHIGVAQSRKRMILIAWKTSIDWKFPCLNQQVCTLHDALMNIGEAENHNIKPLDANSDHYKIAVHIEPGQKLSNVRGGDRSIHTWNIPEVYGDITKKEYSVLESVLKLRRKIRLRKSGDADPVAASDLATDVGFNVSNIIKTLIDKKYLRAINGRYDLCNTFNGKYRRLSWDKPSYTVDTRFTDFRYFLHPIEHRGFTVREAARIQGFSDSFIFYGDDKEQARQVGNAVPPPLARWVANGVKSMLLRKGI